MLTSGSTGYAKAVRLSHRQVVSAISGKSSVRVLPRNGSFFNWVGLDHVASLVEIHIQALWLGVDQVHAHAADIVSSPKPFLDLLDRHHVCRTFAPNFFLAKLVSTVASEPEATVAAPWDLSSLTVVASGGEANDVKTCVAASALFETDGARQNVITPGFSMTETCAGSIFNLECPSYDVAHSYETASLGSCLNGIEMRVTVPTNSGGSIIAAPGLTGNLEVRGAVVFDGYYRNDTATAEAFPYGDGWFRTGDQACINSDGKLRLIGRTKEVIVINGVKIVVADIDSLLDKVLCDQIGRFVVFPSRSEAAHTEQVTIVYVPKTWPHYGPEMAEIERAAVQACISGVSARPQIFCLHPQSVSLMPLSALGKISRAKMRSLHEAGTFDEDARLYSQKLVKYKRQRQLDGGKITSTERLLLGDVASTLNLNPYEIGLDALFFELGCTSLDLIRLKNRLDTRLGTSIPVITLMSNPTVRSLNAAFSPAKLCGATMPYDPVVTFKSTGSKVPLWLVHPGVGEVLVFVGLAQELADDDRPIYALRARGFEPGQTGFYGIEETVTFYTQAIRQRQKRGPYALAGYSYGTMLAFEISKRLNAFESGSTVAFLGSFNLPPHIKTRMRQLSWNMCLLNLAYFLGLAHEESAEDVGNCEYTTLSRHESLAHVVGAADSARMAELGLDDQTLSRWADVAFGLQSLAVNYQPVGDVKCIDVFQAIPLK